MPPINKRPKTSIPGLPTGPAPGVQDYRDPFKKTILNPEPLNPMELVLKQQRERTVAKAAQAGATGKQRKAGAKAVRVLQQTQKAPTAKALERMRIVEEGEAALRYNLNDPLLENSEKLKEVRSEMDRQYYQDQVENGPLLAETSPLVRGFDRAVASTTKELGTIVSDVVPVKRLMTDLFGNDEGVKALFDIGEYISSLGAQAEGELAQFHQYEKPKEAKSLYERGMEFLGSAPVSLAKYATVGRLTGGGAGASFTRQTTGTALGFGGLRVVEAQARGEKDPKRLTEEFALGAVTGALLTSLGKTADVVGHYSKLPGISTLAKAPRTTQAGAQFLGGVAQTHAETFIARDTDSPPDSFDYLTGGLFNVALDPVVFGPSQKAKKATAIAVESTAKWANDQIPPSGLAELRDDFWQPMDVPWSEKVTADLLKRARAQFVEAPGEPEGTLFVNPQAAMILQRLGESLDNPSARVAASTSQGTSLTTEAAQLLSARARAKANEVKQVVAQLPNGHEKLIPYAESAVMYESLADTLDAATAGNRPLNMRFIRQSDMTDPTNPTAVKWSDKVIGHESWHAQDHKTAASVKANWNTLTDPLWLMEHPLGAKLFSTMGDEGNPLGQTGAEHLTGEALAYAAQPGESPIGLTTQERGILVGDYLAHLQDKYGGGILAQRYAGRIDREVAKVAFRRLYEAGRVKFARNGEGKAIGLEWPDIVPPMNQEIPNDPYRGVYQAPLMVGPKEKVNKAIHLNDLWQRFRQSKVRNSKGELIPVYHGSPKGVEIAQVDLNKLNPNDWLHGLFTTQDPKVASGYAKRSGAGDTGQGSNVHKFYLNARNPLDLDAPIPEDLITGLSQVLGIDIGESAKNSDANYILGEIRQQLRDPMRNKEYAAVTNELATVTETLHQTEDNFVNLMYKFDSSAYKNDPEYRNTDYAKQTKAKLDELEGQLNIINTRRRELLQQQASLRAKAQASNLDVIRQLRDALLYLGYDSATHIGGGDAAGRYFKTEAEALAEIDKTGGTLDVRTVEKLAGQLGLELAKKYNLNYETVDYTSIPVIKRFVDLLTAPTNSLVGRIVPENLGRVVKSAEQVLNTYARFSVEHMDDARIDLRWDISIDELRSITVDKLNLMSGAKFDRLVDQTDGWMHDAVVDSLSYADKLKVKEEALKYKRESLTGAEELATAARDVFDEIERQGIERYSTDYIVQGHRVWIAFKPEQVVSATAYSPVVERYLNSSMPLNIERDPVDTNTEAKLFLNFPIWFSSLERFVEAKVKGSMPAQQLAAMIRNGNLRPGELEWTGVLDWLQEQGGRKVTRDEVLSELERRRVDVQEVWKGRGPKDFDELQEVNKAIDDWYAEFYPDNRLVRTLTPEEDARLSALNQRREAIEQRISSSRPRYQNYIQPGESSNYRELLLTLPEKGSADDRWIAEDDDRWIAEDDDRWIAEDDDRWIAEDDDRWIAEDDPRTPAVDDNYRSVHFSEPNILAHVRMTDRKAPDGGKVLFIEEVQSDWHQAGAKQGYKNNQDAKQLEQLKIQVAEAKAAWDKRSNLGDSFHQNAMNKAFDAQQEAMRKGEDWQAADEAYRKTVKDYNDWLDANKRVITEFRQLEDKYEDLKKRVNDNVPDAPFKKTWPELAMRRMIRYAAENGYDQVAWVRGEEADASVGGKSSWFYDRNLVNTANNILKKWGVRVTLPVPPKIKPKQTKFLPADALGWARNSDGLISIYPIKDKAVDYNRQSENIPLDDLARVLDEQSVADIRAAIDNQVNDFGSMAGFEAATHSGKIQRDGIQVADTKYHVLAMADFKKLNTLRNKYSFPITPEMKLSVLKEGQAIPLNIEPDPTILTSTIEETGDITADSLDDIRQINVETISPEQKTTYDSLMSEQTKARNDYRKLAKDLRFAKAAIEAERELQTRSGVDRSESITGLRKYAEDLARRTEAAKVAAKESTVRVNDFRDSLVAELGENTVFGVAPSLSDRAKAIERLKDIANEVPADGDMQQMIMATTKMYAYDRILTDTLISLGPQWNPKRFPDTPLSDLFHQAVAAGHVNIELFSKVLDSNNLSMGEFAQLSRDTIRVAARLMSSKSRAKRILNKMFKADAEFQDWFDKSVPTVREMQALARGRSNIQRILHLGQSLMLTQPATMAMNSIGGGVNVGLRVYLNAFNAGLQKLFYNTRFAGEYFDDSSQTDKRIVPSSFTEIVAPIRELWQVFGYGKEFGKPIPSVQIQAAKNKNILRLQKLIDAFPEVEGKLLAPLEADVESIGTEREAQTLQIWEKQIDLLPAGPKKRRLTQELATAKNRALNEQTRISTRLRQGEALVHRMLRLNRAQEQFFRIGTFLGQLDNYAKQQNIDLVDLEAKNDLSAIPDDLVNRAMEDALEATYGRRPSPRARQGSFDALWYSATRFMNDKLLSGTLVYFPNFAVNFLRQHLELNPLTGIRLLRAMHRSEYAQGNYDAIGKSIFGAMALGAAWLIRSSRYDEEEGKSNLREVGNWPGGTEWYSVGGVDLRPTPFAPFLAMADIYERQRRGLPQQIKTPGQLLQAFGTEQRNLTGMADWLDKALQQLTDGSLIAQDKLKQTAGSAIGEWVSHFATPFQMLTDVVSIFDADQRKLKDTRGMFQGAIIDPTLAKIPYLRNGLPDRIDPLTGRPMVNADSAAGPIARQLTGFRLLPEKSYVGTVFAENGIALRDWIPFTGIPEVDRELVATIARNVSKMTEQYETADIRNRPLDEQVAEMFADYKTEAVAALADTLSKYPELDDYLLERKELNFWERRVEERQQKAKGLPTAEEIYRKRRTERLAKP